ncbi:hypothetical protein BZA77DRAFT_295302 [Pyronema omphalodes]|nr:hypothetical protein BZA77DRAFT_295302 [Pyronema omphalodes]
MDKNKETKESVVVTKMLYSDFMRTQGIVVLVLLPSSSLLLHYNPILYVTKPFTNPNLQTPSILYAFTLFHSILTLQKIRHIQNKKPRNQPSSSPTDYNPNTQPPKYQLHTTTSSPTDSSYTAQDYYYPYPHNGNNNNHNTNPNHNTNHDTNHTNTNPNHTNNNTTNRTPEPQRSRTRIFEAPGSWSWSRSGSGSGSYTGRHSRDCIQEMPATRGSGIWGRIFEVHGSGGHPRASVLEAPA